MYKPLIRTIRGFATPLAFTTGLLALTLLPRVRQNETLTWSFWGAAAVLLGWQAWLALRLAGACSPLDVARGDPEPVEGSGQAVRSQGAATVRVVPPRTQHYVQGACQLSVYAYWGWYWPPVYDFAPLLVGQLLFAYAFDMLLAWTRGEEYALGFGPFPIIFSINLFLWFKDDWFALQFVLVALAFIGKAFVRWQRDGRRVHIFNPSAFALALFSLVLLATGTSSLTWGQEIATTFSLGPRVYTVLFGIGLVVMYFFAITPVTAAAAATLFGASAVYMMATGVPYFVDSEIPAAVFIGLLLLVTDPATSPRTPLGRLVFGISYGLGVFAMYGVLSVLSLPTFYDKLLCVPLLNLTVPTIDRVVRAIGERSLLTRLGLSGPLGHANVPHMAVWMIFFAAMTATGKTDGMHRGDSLPFWQQACAEDRPRACERLLMIETSYCNDNTGWACNELGRHHVEARLVPANLDRALMYFSRACETRFQAGCVNLLDPSDPAQANPRTLDLRLLVREGGPNLMDAPESELYDRACRHGWSFACDTRVASR